MTWTRQRSFVGLRFLSLPFSRSDRFTNRGENVLRALLRRGLGAHNSFMSICGSRAIDQEAQQFGAAVMAARVHQLLALVDACEVEVGRDYAFAGADCFTK